MSTYDEKYGNFISENATNQPNMAVEVNYI